MFKFKELSYINLFDLNESKTDPSLLLRNFAAAHTMQLMDDGMTDGGSCGASGGLHLMVT
jgi:hypothetical protein